MAVTPADVRNVYTEFADTSVYPDSRIALFIGYAQDDMGSDSGRWRTEVRYNRALIARTAHNLVMSKNSEAGDYSPLQAIRERRAGGVSVSHKVGSVVPHSTNEESLMATAYGQEYLRLRRKTFAPLIVNEPRILPLGRGFDNLRRF